MAIEITQNFDYKAQKANFERDNVKKLPLNKVARPIYDVGHIIFCNPTDPTEESTKGAYVWIDAPNDDDTSGWIKFLDAKGKVLIGGGLLIVDNTLNKSSENPVQNKVITTKIESIENTVGEHTNSISQLISSVETNTNDIEAVHTETARLLSDEIIPVQQDVASLKTTVSNHDTTISSHTTTLSTITSDISNINNMLESMQAAIQIKGILLSYEDLIGTYPEGKPGDMYLVQKNEEGMVIQNGYFEYLWIPTELGSEPIPEGSPTGTWEMIGTTAVDVDAIKQLINQEATARQEADNALGTRIDATNTELDNIKTINTNILKRFSDFETPYNSSSLTPNTTVFEATGSGATPQPTPSPAATMTCRSYIRELIVNSEGGVTYRSVPESPEKVVFYLDKYIKDTNSFEHGPTQEFVSEALESTQTFVNISTDLTPFNHIETAPRGNVSVHSVGRFVSDSTIRGRHCVREIYLYLVHSKYFGIIPKTYNIDNITADIINQYGVNKIGITTSSYYNSPEVSLNDQKAFFMLPAYMGRITKVLDKNSFNITGGFDGIASDKTKTIDVNGVPYYIYIEKNSSTAGSAKYSFT